MQFSAAATLLSMVLILPAGHAGAGQFAPAGSGSVVSGGSISAPAYSGKRSYQATGRKFTHAGRGDHKGGGHGASAPGRRHFATSGGTVYRSGSVIYSSSIPGDLNVSGNRIRHHGDRRHDGDRRHGWRGDGWRGHDWVRDMRGHDPRRADRHHGRSFGDIAIVIGAAANAGEEEADPSGIVLENGRCAAGEYCTLRLGPFADSPKIISLNRSGSAITEPTAE